LDEKVLQFGKFVALKATKTAESIDFSDYYTLLKSSPIRSDRLPDWTNIRGSLAIQSFETQNSRVGAIDQHALEFEVIWWHTLT
jgi:hypothetical protein